MNKIAIFNYRNPDDADVAKMNYWLDSMAQKVISISSCCCERGDWNSGYWTNVIFTVLYEPKSNE